MLDGPVEHSADLQSKVSWLSEQLDLKERQLEERNIMMEELGKFASVLAQQAAIALPEGLQMYKEVLIFN